MRRVLLYITILYCLGVVIGAAVKLNPFVFLALLLTLTVVSILYFLKGRKIFCLIYLSLVCYGIFVSSYNLYKLNNETFKFKEQNITIAGQISSSIIKKGNMNIFTMYVDSIEFEGRVYSRSCKIKVIDYKNKDGYIIPFNTTKLSGIFENQPLYKNMYLLYYDKFMIKDDVDGILIADYNSSIESGYSGRRLISKIAYNLKLEIEKIIDKYVDSKSSPIMKGVLFGDMSSIGQDDIELYKKCGIIHIFAVSGANIWLVYFIISTALFFLKKQGALKTYIIIAVLGLYTIMTGASSSIVRAFIMASVLLMGKTMKRKSDPLTSLALAALLILIFNPFEILSKGFQLSFISVASIILLLPKLKKIKLPFEGKIKELLITAAAVQIGILPVTMYYFNSLSVLSIFLNVIIIPFITLFTVMGIILCFISVISIDLAAFMGYLINILGRGILSIINFAGSIPFLSFNVISPNVLELLLYYTAIIIVFKVVSVKEKYRRTINCIIPCLFLLCIIIQVIPGELKICFIDVGQGDSILICTPDRKNILIDGGGKPKSLYSSTDIGNDVLKPYLYRSGVNKIDVMVSTHSHDDHLKGLIPVLENFTVDRFVKTDLCNQDNYKSSDTKALLDAVEVINVLDGDIIEINKDLRLYVLSPGEKYQDENDSSIVIKLVYKDFSILFTGDISGYAEEKINKDKLKSDILKVPHHGSASSLSADFLKAVNPLAAVICVGENNFGHPSVSAIKGIEERDIRLYRTDRDGEIVITTRGKGFSIRTAM